MTTCDLFVLPWADLRDPIQIADVVFWRLDTAELGNYARSPEELQQLTQYFRCYVDHAMRPVSSVAVATIATRGFREADDSEVEAIQQAHDMLVFASIAENSCTSIRWKNPSTPPASSERFELFAHRLHPGDQFMFRVGMTLQTGLLFSEVRFQKPWCTGGILSEPSKKVVEALSRLAARPRSYPQAEHLFRALQVFRFAQMSSESVSEHSRVVLMATAFESLFRCGNVRDKAGWMADKLEKICCSNDHVHETRDTKERTRVGWWMWEFYKLRNAIVHGDKVPVERMVVVTGGAKIPQRFIANMLFFECVIRCLDKRKLIPKFRARDALRKIGETPTPDEVALFREVERRFGLWGFRFSDNHRALGWLPDLPESSRANCSAEAISDEELDELLGSSLAVDETEEAEDA